MTHELQAIFKHFQIAHTQGLPCVLATVVALDGSSYRKPGVRMLFDVNGNSTGAVSGGCVEKEILRQAQSVFESHIPKVITYDGRYRLGCEGFIHILIEEFNPNQSCQDAFEEALVTRKAIETHSYFLPNQTSEKGMGTELVINQIHYNITDQPLQKNLLTDAQVMPPIPRLIIAGMEHDAQQLCAQATLLGWEIIIWKALDQMVGMESFSGASQIKSVSPDSIKKIKMDKYTAVLLMTHNYAKDLHFLLNLSKLSPLFYLGVLGSHKRMEQLQFDLLERDENIDLEFLNTIHGPAGLNIKAITPQEIAISIIAEIVQELRSIPQLTPQSINQIAYE